MRRHDKVLARALLTLTTARTVGVSAFRGRLSACARKVRRARSFALPFKCCHAQEQFGPMRERSPFLPARWPTRLCFTVHVRFTALDEIYGLDEAFGGSPVQVSPSILLCKSRSKTPGETGRGGPPSAYSDSNFLNLAKRCEPSYFSNSWACCRVFVRTPFPGTVIFEQYKKTS